MSERSNDLPFTGQGGPKDLREEVRNVSQQKAFVLLGKPGLQELMDVGRTKLHEIIRQPDFPRPIVLSDNPHSTSLRWVREEVIDYLMKRPRRPVGNEPEHLVAARRYRDGKPVEHPKRGAKPHLRTTAIARSASALLEKGNHGTIHDLEQGRGS